MPVSWRDGLLTATIGGLLVAGVIVGVHRLWPQLPPSTGVVLWASVFTRPMLRWYLRPVRNRGLALSSALVVSFLLVGGLGVVLWGSAIFHDWRWPAIQTGAVWLGTLTFIAATHLGRSAAPATQLSLVR
jgi:hypothetical protein